MKMEITVTEVRDLINEIRQEPESLFEMIRADVQETAIPHQADGFGDDPLQMAQL